MASNTTTGVASSPIGSNQPDPTPNSNEVTSQPGYNAAEPAGDEPRAAHQRAQRASDPGERGQGPQVHAIQLDGGANARVREQSGVRSESPWTVDIPEMSTADLWNKEETRVQPGLAPLSRKPADDSTAESSTTASSDPAAMETIRQRENVPTIQDFLAWREQQNNSDAAPNLADSRQRGLDDRRRVTNEPRHNSRNSVNETRSPKHEQPLAPGQQDKQRDSDLSDSGWKDFFGQWLRPQAAKNDLEGGQDEADSEKPEYDWLGRKLIVGPSRRERKQTPLDPKRAPNDLPTPDATYYDRHGRTELQVFQSLVGIHFLGNAGAPLPNDQKTLQPASVMSDIFVPSRAAAYRHRNRGLYDRCISQDMKMRVMYSFSHYMISFLYLLQILVAATLTGLSSYTNTAGVALTTLGAINTVLAGILAWLNGQGMPVRYRRSRDQFREVVRAIEDAERLFSTIDYMDWPEGTRPTPAGERDRLFKMYEKARRDQEANYPDTQDDADKSEVAATAKTLEAKLEKQKKQKKDKSDEIRLLQEQVLRLQEQLVASVKGSRNG